MTFDELRSRYLEELATPEGCATAHQLEAAINYARGVQGSSCPPAGRERLQVSNPRIQFAGEIERLVEWSHENSVATDYRLETLGEHHAQGTEHLVWFENRMVRRVSFETPEYFNQGPFGQTIEAFEQAALSGEPVVVIENRKASPSEYLERIYLQNLLFNVDNRLHAISEFGIETTQPLFVGEPIDQPGLADFLESFGFSEKSALTWFSSGLQIALSDVALHNVIQVDDAVFPFDIWARRLDPYGADRPK